MTIFRRRPCRRARAMIVVVVAVSAIVPASATAHAAFQDASPEPGSRLSTAPREITLAFTESLNGQLTTARVLDVHSRRSIPASVRVETGNRLLVRPSRRLPTGAFRVEWHTVSILDGHALEGSFGFGVRTSALGGAQRLEQSPLARGGWLRVTLRAVWYAALFFFGGGLMTAVLLQSAAGPAGWLLAGEGPTSLGPGVPRDAALRRIWRRTRAAGWIAVAAGSAVALAETQDAAGSLSWRAIDAYLLSTVSGGARALAVAAVAIAALLAGRVWRLATVGLLLALYAVAVGGHANSASPRTLALLSDWLHLVAATAWAGGIAQIVATWVPGIRRLSFGERRRVVREVLDRFGGLALPAVAVLVAAGAVNALIELGRLSQLWTTAYGRVLMVKIGLTGAVVSASYVHAFRLRPRVIAGAPGYAVAERLHWRLLRSQPALTALILGAAALLAVFPLPPRQLLERAEAGAQPTVAAALRPPQTGELAVAEEAGPWIASALVRPRAGSATGTVRLFDYNVHPVPATIDVLGAQARSCGVGCVTFSAPGALAALHVAARLGGRRHVAVIPVRWEPSGGATARRVLRAAVLSIDRLRSFRISERLSGGFGGPPLISSYRVGGRHAYAILARNAGADRTVGIGSRVWVHQPDGSWLLQQVSPPQDTRELMPWWTHRRGARLLGVHAGRGRRTADLALADLPRPGTEEPPFWFRLRIDLRSMHVLKMRMIAPGHFMNQRYYAFDAPVRIVAPRRRVKTHIVVG